MNVCMYSIMYAFIYVFMYVCMYEFMYICMHVCTYVGTVLLHTVVQVHGRDKFNMIFEILRAL